MTSVAPIVDVDVLQTHRDDHRLVIADVRWYLDGRSGKAAYESGHIPGAVFVDVDHDLSTHRGDPMQGRHPFPTPDEFAAAMARCGIGDGAFVIAYDDTGGMTAGRLVWMLRVLGEDAALLDGGLAAWSGPLEKEAATVGRPATFTSRPWPASRLIDANGVAELARLGPEHGVVIDARAADRYRGDLEPVDPRAGHIPGARNLPWTDNLGADDGYFRSPEALADIYHSRGAQRDKPVVVYCGSGVSACCDLLALERAGFHDTRLFPASWSGWSSDPQRPAAQGAEP